MAMHRHGGPMALARKRPKTSRPMRVLLKRMFQYLGEFRRVVVIGALFSILATLVATIDPLLLMRGIDVLVSSDTTLQTLIIIVTLYLILKVANWIFRGIYTWILSGAQAGFVRRIQTDVYSHLVSADLSYHKNEQSGNVTSRVTSDTDSLSIGIQVIIDISSQILLLVSSFVVLWLVAPIIALTSLVVVPGVILIAVLFGTVGQRIMLASQRAYGAVSGQIAENLSGIHVAKAFNREDELAKNMLELNNKAYRYGFKFMILMSALQPLIRSFGQFGLAALLFVGGSMAVGTQPLLTIGEVFLGITMVNRFMWPLISLAMMSSQVQSSLAAMDRISDVLEAKPAIADGPESVPLKPDADGITFENVTFSYVEDTPVLKGVSFHIKPGETVAVVGHTGAGKTTLAALINRFYDPQEGRILIGDQDIRNVTLKSLHDAISLIPQEPYLFDDTIIENIRYGRPDATHEEIIELCKQIGANEFIEVLADGYDTKIFESGKNLSAGQRQMITIARTMLANPRILILDEATSRLDAYSESLVQDAQAKLFAGRTTVVIAHRLTTIANASRIFVFDHGELVEQGTHEELLALGGIFKSLYDTYYAHQGVEEIDEEIAASVEEVVEEPSPASHGPMGMGTAMGISHLPDPETLKRMLNNPNVPEEVREKIKQRLRGEGLALD